MPPNSDVLPIVVLALLSLVGLAVAAAYIIAPLMLYGIFCRIGSTNELLERQNQLLMRLSADSERVCPPEDDMQESRSEPPIAGFVPTFRLLR